MTLFKRASATTVERFPLPVVALGPTDTLLGCPACDVPTGNGVAEGLHRPDRAGMT